MVEQNVKQINDWKEKNGETWQLCHDYEEQLRQILIECREEECFIGKKSHGQNPFGSAAETFNKM